MSGVRGSLARGAPRLSSSSSTPSTAASSANGKAASKSGAVTAARVMALAAARNVTALLFGGGPVSSGSGAPAPASSAGGASSGANPSSKSHSAEGKVVSGLAVQNLGTAAGSGAAGGSKRARVDKGSKLLSDAALAQARSDSGVEVLKGGKVALEMPAPSLPRTGPTRGMLRKQETKEWFEIPERKLDSATKRELQILSSRNYIDPKRFYKTNAETKKLPKRFQLGTVVEAPSEYFSSRLTKKERQRSLAHELLNDESFQKYAEKNRKALESRRASGGKSLARKKRGPRQSFHIRKRKRK